MVAQTTANVGIVDAQGRPVSLGPRLGGGGEGDVFALSDRPDLVAKIYSQAVPPEKAAKLRLMARLRNDRLLKFAAWPVDTVLDAPAGQIVGLLMPRVAGYKEVHTLYSPKSRLAEFPRATWPFLIHAATNLARAFAMIHESGQVIGDVNHANVVVSDQAVVKLIDCDSFQIVASGRRYLCEVGVPIFQPPEFQSLQTFRGVVRTANHDNFGLAVLIFHLLFMGRHPFAGTYLGASDMSIERAIEEFRFAYGSAAPARRMKQPPHTPSLAAASQPVAVLFERAFAPEGTRDGGRPTARAWIDALATLTTRLTPCARNPAHSFPTGLAACPWCRIETNAGIHLFQIMVGAVARVHAFDLEVIWAAIVAVPTPGPAPALPSRRSLVVQPSARARRFRRQRKAQIIGGAIVAMLGIAAWIVGYPIHGGGAIWSCVAAVGLAWTIANHGAGAARAEARRSLDAARARWNAAKHRWKVEAGDQSFQTALRELTTARGDYLGLPATQQERLRRLDADRQARQLHRFLDQHRVVGAQISGIGPGREAILLSYGIETAADVSPAAVLKIPGFGPTLAGVLLTWRRQVERGFVFDPARANDPRDVAAVERDLLATRASLEQRLLGGPAHLRAIAQQIVARRETLRGEVEQDLTALAQAGADARAIGL